MTSYRTCRTPVRRVRSLVLAVFAVLGAALLLGLVFQSPAPSSSSQPSTPEPSAQPPAPPLEAPHRDRRGPRDGADGRVPDRVTVFDDRFAGVANLDPELLGALRRAAADAAGGGIELLVTSGWRSPEHQTELLRDAVARYGSEAEAARWVATADTSAHVSGDAVDLGPSEATAWLSAHGAAYGLCQIYDNEPWHYELRPAAVGGGCPPMYADPTEDPRMRR